MSCARAKRQVVEGDYPRVAVDRLLRITKLPIVVSYVEVEPGLLFVNGKPCEGFWLLAIRNQPGSQEFIFDKDAARSRYLTLVEFESTSILSDRVAARPDVSVGAS